jgi:hypothetical protein
MKFGIAGADSDKEMKIQARRMVLNRICNEYRKTGDPTFTFAKIEEQLKGLVPNIVDLSIWENWAGSGYLDINKNNKHYLNGKGRKACKRGEFDRV